MAHITIRHNKLGLIRCLKQNNNAFIKLLGLPYGTIPHRFSRAKLCPSLSNSNNERYKDGIFDATVPSPSSIQPWGSVKSDAANIPLPTDNFPDDEAQSEDCLNLSIHLPRTLIDDNAEIHSTAKLPVLVFIHGGAYFLGSANRPYYNPENLVSHAIHRSTPIIFVAINYRLGALGFLHSNHAGDLVPENNGIHDQVLAFEWLRMHIGDFGGDVDNITAIGQSAGAESISVQTMHTPLFKRAIMFSGTPVTMPAMMPDEHHDNFLAQAKKLGLRITEESDDSERDARLIANDMINIDVSKIRDLAWVGLPCTNSTYFPFERPSMQLVKEGKLAPPNWREWAKPVEAQIIGSTTYDGGVSYNMMSKDGSRSGHAEAFTNIAQDVLGPKNGTALLDLYGISSAANDADALQRICLFESDIGFFAAALSLAQADLVPATYFHVFDLGNPFPGPIGNHGAFATHTFDIATLLGGDHEDKLPAHYAPVLSQWRNRILDFVVHGTPPCARYTSAAAGNGLIVDEKGVREVARLPPWLSSHASPPRLFELAASIDPDAGCDILWLEVCRRFLMQSE